MGFAIGISLTLMSTVIAQDIKRPIIEADISYVPSQEDRGTVFSYQGGEKDVLKILADHKFNRIRLRLFVDPTAKNGYSKTGCCGLIGSLRAGRRPPKYFMVKKENSNWILTGLLKQKTSINNANRQLNLREKLYERKARI